MDRLPLNDADLKDLSRQQKLRVLNALQNMESAPQSQAELVSRETPQKFILEVLGEKPTAAALKHKILVPWTDDQHLIYNSVTQYRRTLVQSANGVGKTASCARLALWWLYRYPNSTVVTTAPTDRQVEDLLWGEIRQLWNSSKIKLPGRQLQTRIIVDPTQKWNAYGFTSNIDTQDKLTATGFQGYHNEHTLIIVDEAAGVPKVIMDSIEGMCVGEDDRVVAIANPTNFGSWFYKASQSPSWNRIVIDGLNHPNVRYNDPQIIPGAITKTWIEDRRLEWGEDSPLWICKVRGQWPEQSSDTLIRIEWIDRAQQRYQAALKRDDDRKGVAAGLDVAGEGGDLTVLSAIQNGYWAIPKIAGKRSFHLGMDVMEAVQLVVRAVNDGLDIKILCLDDTGLGQGVTARLRELQRERKLPRFWIYPVNFAHKAWNHEKFDCAKDQLWWQAREVLRTTSDLALPDDRTLESWLLPKGNSFQSQIMTPIYDLARGGRIAVYDKSTGRGHRDKIQHLPDKSPDLAHSFILAVHGWLQLRENKTPVRAETVTQLFYPLLRKIINDSQVRRDSMRNDSRMAPWRRRGR
jgi:phage terminase large subunit